MAGYTAFLLGLIWAFALHPYPAQAALPLNDMDFFVGYKDEEFRIKQIRPKSTRKDVGSYRLPKTVIPLHYDLEITPIFDGPASDEMDSAPGKVAIKIRCIQTTGSIVVHSKGLHITDNKLLVENLSNKTNKVNVTGHNVDADRSFFVIFLDKDLTENDEYLLTIPYRAQIPTDLMAGLYKTTYLASEGHRKTAVVTQFQKDDASRTFPCFDEPQLKAEFTIKIGRMESYQSFSNMEKVGNPEPIANRPGYVWDKYATMVVMPIYTVGFAVVSDFVAEDTPTGLYRLPIKTWIPRSQMTETSAKLSAKVSGQIMKYFEDLFGVPYPLNKMENMAVPDMNLLAMENIGFVTYRPIFLVWTPEENTEFDKFNSASLIAHEFAHMWFGNLVTCEWWNDFWLNEGFARYFQFVGADQVGHDFRGMDRYVVDVVQWAMEFDQTAETVPVHDNNTESVFYKPFHIEYEKGASLVRMMKTFLTQKTFIGGLRRYFKRHLFNVTTQEDLFTAFTEQGREDGTFTKYTVGEVMRVWSDKTGFPILQVSKGDSNRLYISQQRFVVHPSTNQKPEQGLWNIPVWYITKSDPHFDGENSPPQLWMDKDTLTSYIAIANATDWIIINPESRGYYRVIYDNYLTSLIVEQLDKDHTVFSYAVRSQLIDDYFQSARARYLNILQAMAMTEYLHKEDDLMVWSSVFSNLRNIYRRIIDTPLIDTFKKYLKSLMKPALKRLGFERPQNVSRSDIMLQSQLLDWVCSMEDEDCGIVAQNYFAKWMANPSKNPIPADVQNVIYCAAIAFTQNRTIHNFLLGQYKTTKSDRQKQMIVRALTCDSTTKFLTELLENAINQNYAEINITKHGGTLLSNVVTNPLGRKLTWELVKSNFTEITAILGPLAVPNVLESVARYTSNRGISEMSYELMSFISVYSQQITGSNNIRAQNSLSYSAQTIVENSLWMDFFYYDLKDWLKQKTST